MDIEGRSGFEREDTTDPVTGRPIRRMTNYPAHDIQPYYDICPWSPDGSKIVFSSAKAGDLADTGGIMTTSNGHLFMMDADGRNIERLTGGAPFDSHTGSFPLWTPDGATIVYGNGMQPHRVRILSVADRSVETVDGIQPRQLSPDGKRLLCQSPKGVEVLSMDGRRRDVVLTFERLIGALPPYDADLASDPTACNLKWSPDGSRFLLRFSFSPGEYMKSLFVSSADGSDVRRIDRASTSFHHHSWHPDGERILYGDYDHPDEPRYYLIDRDGRERVEVTPELILGHPLLNPDATKIISDNYHEKLGHRILEIDVRTGAVETLASFTVNLTRSNAHPTWNRDGSQVIYHSDHTGTSQLYVIAMD